MFKWEGSAAGVGIRGVPGKVYSYCSRLILALIALIGLAGSFWAGESGARVPFIYQVEPPKASTEDLSGEVGQRLLKLLGIRAKKHLDWVRQECQKAGQGGNDIVLPMPDKPSAGLDYTLYRATGSIYVWAAALPVA